MDNQSAATQVELLQPAIESGDTTKILQFLQQNDVDVTAVNDDGDTVLHLILRSVNFAPLLSPIKIIEMMDIFISRGVDPNIKNMNQETALHLAIAPQLKDVVDYLLKHKSNINVVDDKGNSAAHYFIKNSCELLKNNKKCSKSYNTHVHNYTETAKKEGSSFVEWLISRGVDFDLKNKVGRSALHLAIEFNMQHILATLVRNTRDINFLTEFEKRNLLYLFLKTIHVYDKPSRKTAKLMVGYYPVLPLPRNRFFPQISGYQSTIPLVSEVFPSEFSVEIVQILLERGVSVDLEDKDGLTPLHLAIRNKVQMPILLVMMDRLVNISDELTVTLADEIIKTSRSPYFDYLKILDILTTKAINISAKDANGKTCLYHAVKYNDLKSLELLKTKGALDFGVLTNDGENLLHALAEEDLLKFSSGTSPNPDRDVIFDLLISEGCDVHAKNRGGQTPLHWAARYFNHAVARKLIARGAEIDCREYEKDSCPLHEAVSQGSVEVADLLLKNGANVNGTSREGRPLHLATNCQINDMVTTLLKHKAEVNARDRAGDTTLAKTLCDEINCFRIFNNMQALLEHGADINDASVIRVIAPRMENPVGQFLLHHWIKLWTANLPCSNEYQIHIVVDKSYEQLREDCLREIEIMKSTFIDTNTSLYGWLHMDPNRRYLHCQNEKLKNYIDSPLIKEQFPQYSTVILGTFRETLARKSLLEPAKEAWLRLTGILLPDLCIERIFAYLNTGDLFEMAEIINEVD